MTVHNRLVLAGTYQGTIQIRSVFYYKTVFTTINQSVAQSLLNGLYSGTGLCTYTSDQVTYDGVYLSHWTGPADGIWWQETEPHRKPEPPWTMGDFVTITGIDGTIATNDLGPVASCLVTAYTSAKRVRGHKYLPGIPEVYQNQGKILDALLTAVSSFASSWNDAITIGSDLATPELWGYRWGFNEITTAVARDVISTQRRRQYGRGV